MSEGIDSALASVAPVAPAEAFRTLPMSAVPPLTWLSVAGCAGDLFISRVVLRSWADVLSRDAFLELDRWGAFSQNLAAVSALVALGFCLAAYAPRRSGLPLSARVGIMGFGWAFVPIVTLMTFLPLAWTRVELVLVVACLAHALIFLVILAGIQWRSTKAVSIALALLLITYLSGILSLAVTIMGGRALWEHTERLSFAFRWSGELAFLAIPIALAFALRLNWRRPRGWLALVVSTVTVMAVSLAIIAWGGAVGDEFPNLFYGAFRLDLFAEYGAMAWYAIPLGIFAAVGVASVLSEDPAQRQLGAALLLLLCSGYAPRTPLSLLTSVLAVALVSRVALAQDQVRT
ncbi:MAG: hypothetical protein WBG86_20265 [Polyangiales bacterium]